MSDQTARDLALKRWRRPDVLDQRVDSLAAVIRRKVDALPPLTEAQRAKLAALLRPATGGSDAT